MTSYGSLCDDFYVNVNLSTEMELPASRETVLHFFDRVRKTYPSMRNFLCRERGDFVLEEDKDQGSYRWCAIEARRICSGMLNPDDVQAAMKQHRLILDVAPYALSISTLDCEMLDVLIGFDFTYRGNHNQVVSEALGLSPALERLADIPGAMVMNHEPALVIALDDECRLQCRVAVETRTNPYQVRTGNYPEEQLSVYVSAMHYGSLPADATFEGTANRLLEICQEVIQKHVIDHVLRPLARTMALK